MQLSNASLPKSYILNPKSSFFPPRTSAYSAVKKIAFAIALCVALLAPAVSAATARPEPQMAQPDLSEDDLDALQALFDRMSECFLRGDSKALKAFLAETPERDEIVTALRREFKDAQYLDFQVDRPIPDNSFAKNRHSVDVTIRFKLVYKDDSRSPDLRKPVENTTFQSFVVQRESDGAFKIVNSSFFDNLGRRSGGMRMFVHILLFVMLLLLVLPFWVWMCAEAWFIRPRNWLWRCVAAVPAVGSLIFFFFRYLRKRKK